MDLRLEDNMQELLLSHDVGRILCLTPAQVRQLARQGRLQPEAVTPSGVRLWSAAAVEKVRRQRDGAQ
jgi:DNA-binding transcriptional MerR regulator